MKKYMILFSVGKDRPGIVDDVSTLLFERGANIEDSRMAARGGRFSIMTLFSCSLDQYPIPEHAGCQCPSLRGAPIRSYIGGTCACGKIDHKSET
jgi:hypothetical protein